MTSVPLSDSFYLIGHHAGERGRRRQEAWLAGATDPISPPPTEAELRERAWFFTRLPQVGRLFDGALDGMFNHPKAVEGEIPPVVVAHLESRYEIREAKWDKQIKDMVQESQRRYRERNRSRDPGGS